MDLYEKIRTLPTQPGVYLYKNAEGEVIYVGKAKNLRSRVRSYLLEASQGQRQNRLAHARSRRPRITSSSPTSMKPLPSKTTSSSSASPASTSCCATTRPTPTSNSRSPTATPKSSSPAACAKTAPPTTAPTSPATSPTAFVELIHRSFLIPSCKVDLSRYHPRACLQYYIHRCLGPCVEGFTTPETYKQAGARHATLPRRPRPRVGALADHTHDRGSRNRTVRSCGAPARPTLHRASAPGEAAHRHRRAGRRDADVFGYHFEDGSLAVNLFHMRAGKIVDRREFFWDDLPDLLEAMPTAIRDQGSGIKTKPKPPTVP